MAHGPNTIEINGAAMLLTTVSGGNAVHLTATAAPAAGREALPDFYFDNGNDRVPADYDLAAFARTTMVRQDTEPFRVTVGCAA
ncbi:hypothetical protein [Phytohabitans suffuscus]|nr:hypothetical protein [Phytohabitans suffuscus]